MTLQRDLDLLGFNAETAHLDLRIRAAEEFDDPVPAIASAVAGAIERYVRRHRGSGDEPRRGQLRIVEIASRQAHAADIDFADDADRHGLAARVEDVNGRVGEGAPDRRQPGPGRRRAGEPVLGHRMGFGRAVLVVQRESGAHGQPADRRRDLELLAGGDDLVQTSRDLRQAHGAFRKLLQCDETGGRAALRRRAR